MTNETMPQRVRRMGREYSNKYFSEKHAHERGQIAFAWEQGHWRARNEFMEKVEQIAVALDRWEADWNAAELVAVLDAELDEFFSDDERGA